MSGPQIYRKKPVAVEVMCFDPPTLERAHEIRDWINKPGTLGLAGTAAILMIGNPIVILLMIYGVPLGLVIVIALAIGSCGTGRKW